MQEDNIYPSTTAFTPFNTQSEEKKEEQAERKAYEEKRDLVKEIIERFEMRLEVLDSVKAIPAEVRHDQVRFMHAVAGNDIAADELRVELEYLKGLQDAYDKK